MEENYSSYSLSLLSVNAFIIKVIVNLQFTANDNNFITEEPCPKRQKQ